MIRRPSGLTLVTDVSSSDQCDSLPTPNASATRLM